MSRFLILAVMLGFCAITVQPAAAQNSQRRNQEILRKREEKIETYRRAQGVIRDVARQLEDMAQADADDSDPPVADDDDD